MTRSQIEQALERLDAAANTDVPALCRDWLEQDAEIERLKAALAKAQTKATAGRPKVICLCGSTRFIDTWISEYQRLSDEGNIVLTVARMPPRPNLQHDQPDLKVRLDELHKRKIDLADEVFVLNVGGYIGDSTRGEIVYAEAHGKPVFYLSAASDSQPTAEATARPARVRDLLRARGIEERSPEMQQRSISEETGENGNG